MDNKFYKICLRHAGKNDNTFLFWGKNNSGYYRSVEDAGLYEESSFTFSEQVEQGDFLVSKDIVDKLIKRIILPTYGDSQEKYAGRNSFNVLPNTGQVRKELGVTSLDFKLDCDRNSFKAYFKNEIIEDYKYCYSKTHFRVKAKEYVSEFWYMDGEFEAENRNKAILKAFNDWLPNNYSNYIDFKQDVTCVRVKTKVLNKWVKLDG